MLLMFAYGGPFRSASGSLGFGCSSALWWSFAAQRQAVWGLATALLCGGVLQRSVKQFGVWLLLCFVAESCSAASGSLGSGYSSALWWIFAAQRQVVWALAAALPCGGVLQRSVKQFGVWLLLCFVVEFCSAASGSLGSDHCSALWWSFAAQRQVVWALAAALPCDGVLQCSVKQFGVWLLLCFVVESCIAASGSLGSDYCSALWWSFAAQRQVVWALAAALPCDGVLQCSIKQFGVWLLLCFLVESCHTVSSSLVSIHSCNVVGMVTSSLALHAGTVGPSAVSLCHG